MALPPLLNTPPEVLGEVAAFLQADDVFTLLDSHPLVPVTLLQKGGVTSFFWNREQDNRVKIRLKTRNLFRRVRSLTVRVSPFLIDWCEIAARSELAFWSKKLTSIDCQSRDALELWYEYDTDGKPKAMDLNSLFPRLERLRLHGRTWKRLVQGRNAPTYQGVENLSGSSSQQASQDKEWTSVMRKDFAAHLPEYLKYLSLSHYDDFEVPHYRRLVHLQHLEVPRDVLAKKPPIEIWPNFFPPNLSVFSCHNFDRYDAEQLVESITTLEADFSCAFDHLLRALPAHLRHLSLTSLARQYFQLAGAYNQNTFPPLLESFYLDIPFTRAETALQFLPKTLTSLHWTTILTLTETELSLLPPGLTTLRLPNSCVNLIALEHLPSSITDLAICTSVDGPEVAHIRLRGQGAPAIMGAEDQRAIKHAQSKSVFPAALKTLALTLNPLQPVEMILPIVPPSILHLTLIGESVHKMKDLDLLFLPRKLATLTVPSHALTQHCLTPGTFPTSLYSFKTDFLNVTGPISSTQPGLPEKDIFKDVERAWRARFGDFPSDTFELRMVRL